MSTKGIYTAVSGAIAQDARLETIANNIANANTPSFKKDQQVFREYLTSHEKLPDVLQVPKVPASVESFYDMQGGDKSYVDVAGTYTDFKQGSIKNTGNNLDVAIEGQGFFEVLTPQGIRFTRFGSFNIDGEGRLVTKQGFPVLATGTDAQEPQSRVIRIAPGQAISIGNRGQVQQNDQPLGQLSIVSVDNQDGLQKIGSSLYKTKDNYQLAINRNPEIELHQGSLEMSNVNIIKEMTDMISTTRTFESLQKAIQAYDQMSDKLINNIPKF